MTAKIAEGSKEHRWGEGDPSILGSAKEMTWIITHKHPVFATVVFVLLVVGIVSWIR